MEGYAFVLFKNNGTDSDLEDEESEEDEQQLISPNDVEVKDVKDEKDMAEKDKVRDESHENNNGATYSSQSFEVNEVEEEDFVKYSVSETFEDAMQRRGRLLTRPGHFPQYHTPETYITYPPLRLSNPIFPRVALPLPWGIPVYKEKKIARHDLERLHRAPEQKEEQLDTGLDAISHLARYYGTQRTSVAPSIS